MGYSIEAPRHSPLEVLTSVQANDRAQRVRRSSLILLCALAAFSLLHEATWPNWFGGHRGQRSPKHDLCPQYDPLRPKWSEYDALRTEYTSHAYRNASVDRLSRAIQIRTETFDNMGSLENDTRWEIFERFANYLNTTYSIIFDTVNVTIVNKHGLIFSWQGSDVSLKPLLLMAHQDVVPVAPQTAKRWTHPPFEGHSDGTYIWGRGAGDDKNSLIGIMESTTLLIKHGFAPRRTIIFSFGFDEEISGFKGAGALANYLKDLYGPDSMAMIIDEEGAGSGDLYGRFMAIPAMGEKGYLDIQLTVDVPGGHSSVPPDHTGIGILSEMIVAIEAEPYKPYLAKSNPMHATFQCAAKYGPSMDEKLRRLLKKDDEKSLAKAVEILSLDRDFQYLFRTSQAVDLIEGGIKVNSLPEVSTAVVNHRISVESNLDVVKQKIKRIARKTAEKHGIRLLAYPQDEDEPSGEAGSQGRIRLDVLRELAPAPTTPTSGLVWEMFSGTVQSVYAEDQPIVAPALMSGNTDTKFYWELSKHIYRFTPARSNELLNLHTVDERISIRSYLEGILFYATVILNADEQDL